MIPSESNIDNVGFILALEGFQILWRIVRIVLGYVDLLALTPHIDISRHFGEPLFTFLGGIAVRLLSLNKLLIDW